MQTILGKPYVKTLIVVILVAAIVSAAVVVATISMNYPTFPPLFSSNTTFPPTQNFYVIYYGHLVNYDGKITNQTLQIIAAKPKLVIVPYSLQDGEPNLTPRVVEQFHKAGIKVVTYTWTKYGNRSIDEVKSDISKQLIAGADGIFIDEVTNIETDREYNYYSTIYNYIKNYDPDKLVVMNPGHYKVTERIMQISDIVSLEEEWTYYKHIPWKDHYAPARFMGVSSNEYCDNCTTNSNAANKTRDAWNSGIGYHFSTDKYIDLPNWFDDYISNVKEKDVSTIQS